MIKEGCQAPKATLTRNAQMQGFKAVGRRWAEAGGQSQNGVPTTRAADEDLPPILRVQIQHGLAWLAQQAHESATLSSR